MHNSIIKSETHTGKIMKDFKPTDTQILDITEKALELAASEFAGEHAEMLEYIMCGYAENFLSLFAYMASFKIRGELMSDKDFETNKIACLQVCQKMQEEIQPLIEDRFQELYDDLESEHYNEKES